MTMTTTTNMKVNVRGFCGIREADLNFSGMCLLSGRNGSGKTSTCRAVGAALTGVPMPFLRASPSKPGTLTAVLSKQQGDDVVHTGVPSGSVTVSVTGPTAETSGTASVAWPDARPSRRGTMPPCSPAAAGLVRISDFDRKAMTALMVEKLGALPSKDDLVAAIAKVDVLAGGFFDDPAAPDFQSALSAAANEAWETVRANGWDAAASDMAAAATERKGHWQAITGERYGPEKATSWVPSAGWSLDLVGADLEVLADAADAAQRAYMEALAAAAVETASRDALAKTAAGIPDLEAAMTAAAARMETARSDHMAAMSARDAMPAIFGQSGLPCPHCGKMVRVAKHPSGQEFFEKFEEAKSLDDVTKREKELKEADDKVKATKAVWFSASDHHAAARMALEAARVAKSELDNLPAQEGPAASAAQHATAGAALNKAKQQQDEARQQQEAASAFRRALECATNVAAYATVADLLKPTGVRRDVLRKKLADFNGRLAALCETAGWPIVRLTDDLEILCDGRSILLMSASERYRCDVLLQIAIAEIEGSGVLIIDGIDILDRDNRNGLLAILLALPKIAILTMTANSPATLPDLHKGGVGETYWIENGTAIPLAQTLSVAAAAE